MATHEFNIRLTVCSHPDLVMRPCPKSRKRRCKGNLATLRHTNCNTCHVLLSNKHQSGTLYELFADLDTDNEVAERCGLCDEGDEAIPVSHCSVSRAACKPTPEQADGRIERNTTTKTLKRAEWYERKSLDGDTIMETRKVMKVIYHHSHGLRGRKPIKPSRETLRRMQVVDHSTSFLDQEYAEVMSG
jgi:hypothetical protein